MNSVSCKSSSSAECVVTEYLAASSDGAGHQCQGVPNSAVAVSAVDGVKRKPADQVGYQYTGINPCYTFASLFSIG